jgi:hypothetical protein
MRQSTLGWQLRSTQFRHNCFPNPGRSSTQVGAPSPDRVTFTFLASIPAAIPKPKQARRLAQISSDSGKGPLGGRTMRMRVGMELRLERGAWPRGCCACWLRLSLTHERSRPATSSSSARPLRPPLRQTRNRCFRHAGPSIRLSSKLWTRASWFASAELPGDGFENALVQNSRSTASKRRIAADGGAKLTPLAMAEWWSL